MHDCNLEVMLWCVMGHGEKGKGGELTFIGHLPCCTTSFMPSVRKNNQRTHLRSVSELTRVSQLVARSNGIQPQARLA